MFNQESQPNRNNLQSQLTELNQQSQRTGIYQQSQSSGFNQQPQPGMLNFDGSQTLQEFSPISSPILFQDYDFSDEIDSWDAVTDDEIQLCHTRSNSVSSTPYLSSSGSSSNEESVDRSSKFGPPPFKTPPKLQTIQDVLGDNPGTEVANLRNLAISLAKDAIFGKEEMMRCSLSGRKNTATLDEKKLKYIKTIIQSRVPRMSETEFEHLWLLCRGSISKSCQCLRTKAKRKLH